MCTKSPGVIVWPNLCLPAARVLPNAELSPSLPEHIIQQQRERKSFTETNPNLRFGLPRIHSSTFSAEPGIWQCDRCHILPTVKSKDRFDCLGLLRVNEHFHLLRLLLRSSLYPYGGDTCHISILLHELLHPYPRYPKHHKAPHWQQTSQSTCAANGVPLYVIPISYGWPQSHFHCQSNGLFYKA